MNAFRDVIVIIKCSFQIYRQLIKSWGFFIGAVFVARQLAEASEAAAAELANPVPA